MSGGMSGAALVLLAVLFVEFAYLGGLTPLSTIGKAATGELVLP